MVFQGIRGSGYQGDIALDDISFVNGPCPPTSEFDTYFTRPLLSVCFYYA